MLYEMVYIICVLHEPVNVQEMQGMEEFNFCSKDDSC